MSDLGDFDIRNILIWFPLLGAEMWRSAPISRQGMSGLQFVPRSLKTAGAISFHITLTDAPRLLALNITSASLSEFMILGSVKLEKAAAAVSIGFD
jgi:hypothetical protein